MTAVQVESVDHDGPVVEQKRRRSMEKFAGFAFVFQVAMVIIMGCCFKYGTTAENKDGGVAFYYPMFQDVHVMIFVGFGFLMTFMQNYTFGASGFNMMIAAFTIQWAIIVTNVIGAWWHHGSATNIPMTMETMILGDFGAAAILITFGAFIGRVSPMQLMVIGIFEMIFYTVNEELGAVTLKAVDMGGSMWVHVFGAYYGLAISWMLARGKVSTIKDHALNGATKYTDTFAMIGTLFLWMFWPSFTGALAEEEQKFRVVVNTILSLCSCCVCTFAFTLIFRKNRKFSMVDIQNATLAGGVAVGSSCDLAIQPWGAMTIGVVAAAVSVWGYTCLMPFLEDKIGLFDTCGVHNLHGMPGVIGGLGGVVNALIATKSMYQEYENGAEHIYEARAYRTAGEQAGYQFAALLHTLAIAIVSGLFVGAIVRLPFFDPVTEDFEDAVYWEVEKMPVHMDLEHDEEACVDEEAVKDEAAASPPVQEGTDANENSCKTEG